MDDLRDFNHELEMVLIFCNKFDTTELSDCCEYVVNILKDEVKKKKPDFNYRLFVDLNYYSQPSLISFFEIGFLFYFTKVLARQSFLKVFVDDFIAFINKL